MKMLPGVIDANRTPTGIAKEKGSVVGRKRHRQLTEQRYCWV